jgi:signal transduction histidine kinase
MDQVLRILKPLRLGMRDVPLWLKIMGIVVSPLLLVSASMLVYIRQKVLSTLVQEEHIEVLPDLYPVLTGQAISAVLIAILLGVLLAYALSLILVRPLHQLLAVIQRVEAGDLSGRVQVWAQDEIGWVQAAFNLMTEKIERMQKALVDRNQQLTQANLSNAQLLEDIQRKEAELRRALRRSVDLQEEERKRLARELHDEVGQALTSILIRLKTLQNERDMETIHGRLDGLRYLTSQTIEELRRMAMDLRPAALDNLGIVPALRWYAQQTAERTGLSVILLAPEKLERLPPEVELTLYRVAQEGVTNAIRHSQAREIEVALKRGPHAIWLSISDDGRGFDPSVNRGLGLIGIRERMELLGGTCGLESALGAGTRLWIEIPREGLSEK